jgi:predicted SAM-dependent methyltransferase
MQWLLPLYRQRVRAPYLRFRTWLRCKRLARMPAPRQLEIGPGSLQPPPGWLTLDIYSTATFFADLRHPLPFPTDIFDTVYCSHVFEHFTIIELRRIFAECLRIIRPGGSLDVVVPNGGLYVRAYGDEAVRRELLGHIGHSPDFDVGTRMDLVNHMAHMCGEHQFLFDAENLVALFRQAGFVDVRLRAFDANREHESRRFESICAVGRKPLAQ